MNDTLDLNDTIKGHVSQLSYDWFLGKEKEFKSICEFYGSEETIVCVNHDIFIEDKWFIEVDELGISPGDSFVEDVIIDLRKFCDCYLPLDTRTGCGQYPMKDWLLHSEDIEPSNIDVFASNLIADIEVFAKDILNDINTLGKFIFKVQEIIDKELYLLKIANPKKSNIYVNVLDDFLSKCMAKIYSKYARELTVYNFTAEQTEQNSKLDFLLTQEQLVGLIFILNKAGFFLNDDDHKRVLRFCLKHFRYNGGDGNPISPTSFDILNKEYSDVKASHYKDSKRAGNHKGLNFIADQLSAVIEKLL